MSEVLSNKWLWAGFTVGVAYYLYRQGYIPIDLPHGDAASFVKGGWKLVNVDALPEQKAKMWGPVTNGYAVENNAIFLYNDNDTRCYYVPDYGMVQTLQAVGMKPTTKTNIVARHFIGKLNL
eukprot:TRINITY_DN14377_c0_g1_i2.p3 TRINITY_DN14377_c0_g1~~TRINITY_DN14377_c0_g1_i2.p3  ORF type:complete len:122 (-),score=31.87 TRINITY_DN14377_c0_g1_i2:661-1026(-)